MPTYRTPDVYVEEISVFPPSVAEVETAIPAFIGYTGQARKVSAGDLSNRPTKIYNFAEYEQYFGGPDTPDIDVALVADGPGFIATVTAPTVTYLLYYAVKMFFDNGGGKCYIVSVGGYADAIDIADFTAGLDAVALEDEPTLLVCPEAVRLSGTGYDTMSQNMLIQCGTLKDRFAILDLFGGDAPQDNTALTANRARIGNNNLKYGALYYPFLRSSFNHAVAGIGTNVNVTVGGGAAATLDTLQTSATAVFNAAKAALLDHYIVVPPSGGVAGVYAATDTARGVWKAPANVGLADVVEPTVRLDNAHQDELNVDATTGKSINAIRAFAGKGTLVWGARTLAGTESQASEWKYVSVRRLTIFVEQSIDAGTKWVVFEPNGEPLWAKLRASIGNFLGGLWTSGAFVGNTPTQSFFVRCDRTTMTQADIDNGVVNIVIGVAPVQRAEFVIFTISQFAASN